MSDLYYLQDSRNYVGNCALFWRKDGGYTTNIDEAEIFTAEKAIEQNKSRKTDIIRHKTFIDERKISVFDVNKF